MITGETEPGGREPMGRMGESPKKKEPIPKLGTRLSGSA
jgi:hypothetical protein